VTTRRYKGQQGLTLVEIMVVLVILALVMTFLGGRLFGAGDKAKANITKLKIKEIGNSIEQYRLMYNSLPGSLQDLTQCNEKTGPGCIPIIDANSDTLNDAWGNAFSYSLENGGRTYRITSFGADGAQGGEGVNFDHFGTGP
jgi:general secretion pathway protein G